jgi:hypothetical protein
MLSGGAVATTEKKDCTREIEERRESKTRREGEKDEHVFLFLFYCDSQPKKI